MYFPKKGRNVTVQTEAFGQIQSKDIPTDIITGVTIRGLKAGAVEKDGPNKGKKYITFTFGRANRPAHATVYEEQKTAFELLSTCKDGDIVNLQTTPSSRPFTTGSGVQLVPRMNKVYAAEPGKLASPAMSE
jgi:hypothetical protein